jgi:O-methyltransferase involved in polyketide biosynthesis
MLVGGRLIELGCGFNPKAPRFTAYPAGSNAPGALHFGIDLAKPADYIRRVMPQWEEPPVHVDLVTLDASVAAGSHTLIENGFLTALRDPPVVEAARRYGDPVDLLEGSV